MASGAPRDSEHSVAPVQVRGPVLTLRRIDAYHALTMVALAIATRFKPGQFVTVSVGGPETSMLLRRAFSIHEVRPDHGGRWRCPQTGRVYIEGNGGDVVTLSET
jgi:NAD(P)H-flavin reductase